MQRKNETNVQFIEKLIKLQKTGGFLKKELAAKLLVSPQYLSALLNGRKPGKMVSALVDKLISEHETKVNYPSNSTEPMEKSELGWRKIPVVSWATAGRGVSFEDMCRQIEEWIETDNRDPNAYAIIIEGDSMEPEIRSGDVVTVLPNQSARNGDFVVAKLTTGEVFFKRFRRTGPEGQTIILESLNPDYPTKEFRIDQFEWVYPAWDVKRRLRR